MKAMTPQDRATTSIDTAVPVTADQFRARRRRLILICSGVAVALAGLTYLSYRHLMDPIHAREAYDDAKRLAATTRYSQSILAATRAIALNPSYADAYFLRGQTYAEQRELDRAEADFTALTKLEPRNARAYAGRCAIRFEYRDYQGAINDCGKAIQFDASIPRAYNIRGIARRAQNDLQGSLADLSHAVELSPDIENLFQRAATLRAMNDYKGAISDFDHAASLYQGNPEVYRARAEAKRAMGDEKGALEDYALSNAIEHRQ